MGGLGGLPNHSAGGSLTPRALEGINFIFLRRALEVILEGRCRIDVETMHSLLRIEGIWYLVSGVWYLVSGIVFPNRHVSSKGEMERFFRQQQCGWRSMSSRLTDADTMRWEINKIPRIFTFLSVSSSTSLSVTTHLASPHHHRPRTPSPKSSLDIPSIYFSSLPSALVYK